MQLINNIKSTMSTAYIVYNLLRSGIPLGRYFGWNRNKVAGEIVTPETALTLSGLYRGISYISDSIMTMPWDVNFVAENRATYPLNNNLRYLLNERVNNELTTNIWLSVMIAVAILRGNSYSEILKDNKGAILALGHPIHPDRARMLRDRDTNEIFYRFYPGRDQAIKETVDLPQDLVFHLRGFGDGYTGDSIMEHARKTIGIGLAQENNVSNFFGNGARTSGVLEHPGVLEITKRNELAQHMRETLTGNQAFNVLVLQKGETWKQTGMNNNDAQTLESRQFTVLDIARFLGIPPPFLMDYSRATWANLEQARTEVVQSGLLPWAVRLECEANFKLIPKSRQRRVSTKINLDGLLRADTKTRFEAYTQAIGNTLMTPNEARKREGLPPVEGLDIFYAPLNMQILDAKPPDLPPGVLGGPNNLSAAERHYLDLLRMEDHHSQASKSWIQSNEIDMVAQKNEAINQQEDLPLFGKALDMEHVRNGLQSLVQRTWRSILSRETNQLLMRIGKDDFQIWASDWIKDKQLSYALDQFNFLNKMIAQMHDNNKILPDSAIHEYVHSYTDKLNAIAKEMKNWDQVKITDYGLNRADAVYSLTDEFFQMYERLWS